MRAIGPMGAIALMSCAMFAQSPPAIEVATAKPNKTSQSIGNRFDPERMSWTGVPLKNLIEEAYGVRSYQIAGGPVWLDSDRWDINAKTEGPTTFQQKLVLLRTLLEDRFQLKFHRETRDVKGYKLVIAPNGPKLHQAPPDGGASPPAGTRIGRGLIAGHGVEIEELAHFLESELGRPVEEATGLTGKYDFKLEWVPDESQPNSGGEAPPPNAEGATVFRAIQEQLGLKLEPQKGPLEVLVVDRAEKPGGN